MRPLFAFLAMLLLLHPLGAKAAEGEQLVGQVRFTDYESGPVEEWLEAKGFVLQQDAKKRNKIDLNVSDQGLVVEAKTKAFGFLTNESVNAPVFRFVEIDWGVTLFPEGASYEQGVRNEAIMVEFFMGDERLSSGSLFIPDSPYFVGLFICHDDDKLNFPYVGSYFKKGGRYVCVDQPKVGEMVTTRYDLLAAYRAFFDKEGDDDPAVSGIAIEVDTSKASGKGLSSAFVKEIRVYR